jgi:hypothetical protein
MARKKNQRKKRAAAKVPKKAQRRESESFDQRHMNIQDFLFDSIYQVVTWVCIALAIGSIFYFASKSSNRGVMWSITALLCFVTIMIGIMADRHFFRGDVAGKERSEESGTNPPNVRLPESVIIDSSPTPTGTPSSTVTPKPLPSTQPLSIAERPYVVVESALLTTVAPNEPTSPMITIVNKGRTPAQHISLSLKIAAKPGFVYWLGFGDDDGRHPVNIASLAAGDRVSVRGAPADEVTLHTKFFNDVMKGKESLMIHGKGIFEDMTGAEYALEYAFGYHPATNGFIADFGGPNRREKWMDDKKQKQEKQTNAN